MSSCKPDCESLMSAVLPDAERLLSEQRTLRPFGSTLSADDRIVAVGVTSNSEAFDAAALVLEFQNSFRDGAARGELKATALVYTARDERSDPPLSVVRVNLDHRENYS